MLLTRESDYALRILRELSDGELRTVGDICEREAVPNQFAYKILKKLEIAGLIRIMRGARGGCRCTDRLGEATLYDVLHAVGENQYLNACMDPKYECMWKQKYNKVCKVHERLELLGKSLEDELKSIYIRDFF